MSAINNKNKKKKNNNKKKGKKQGNTPVDSTTPSEISSPALTDSENLIQEESATASALPAAPIVADEPADSGTPTSKIPAGGPVGVGAAGAGATAAAVAVAARKSISQGSKPALLPEPLPLSDNVKYCIKTVVASGSLDILSIVNTVKKNVEAGDYKPKAALPAAAATATSANTAKPASAAAAVPTPPKDTPPKDTTTSTDKASKGETVKKAAAGAGAAIAGAGAAAVAAVKGKDKKEAEKTPSTTTTTTSTTSATKNLSENVQHCIQSVVQAPSVNVYGILDAANPNKIKAPEPAVGGSMPSSAKAADPAAAAPAPVPPKGNEHKKGKENRKSGIAALKKKNCIIL